MSRLEELRGASEMAFARTRSKSQTECKWIAEFTRGAETICVGSLIPARDLIKGGRRLSIVGHRDGVLLIGYARKQLDAVVAQLPPLAGRLEILTLESVLHEVNAYDGPSLDRMLAVHVSVDPDDIARRQVRALAASFIAAKSVLWQPAAEDRGWLALSQDGVPISHICISVALQEYEVGAARELGAMIRAARDAAPDAVVLVIGLAREPRQWATLSLDGFVASVSPATDSQRVLEMLAALQAPGHMCALDIYDLDGVFGPAENPSEFMQACFCPDSGSLSMSNRLTAVLTRAHSIALMPSRSVNPAQQAAIVRAVAGLAHCDATVTQLAPFGLQADRLAAHLPVLISGVCSPHGETQDDSIKSYER